MLKHFVSATDTLKELIFFYVMMMTLSAVLFSFAEDVTFGTALYWAGITATTTGYGDISPHTAFGRTLSVILANVSVFILGPLIISRMLQFLVNNPDNFDHTEQEEIKERLQRIEDLLISENKPQGSDRYGHN